MEPQFLALVIAITCTCLASAGPTNNRREDLTHLVSLLGKLKDIERVRQTPTLDNGARVSDFPELPDSDVTESRLSDEDLTKGYLGRPAGTPSKRQGAWSYDYGLGGGRFGKRNYGDYGIGGGRFGRDVDHVDVSDANDADVSS